MRDAETGLTDAFWETAARYDGSDYDLSHLQPLERRLITPKGASISVGVRFSYHCATDKPGRRDLGARIREATRPAEERYFCPVRWFLSRRLPELLRAMDARRLVPVAGYQWLYSERIPGISLPWVVWIKVMPGREKMLVVVESAYLAGSPPKGGKAETFRFIVEQTQRTGRLYGLADRV
jgi:hypothetical protein